MMHAADLTCIIPAYNEADRIPGVLKAISKTNIKKIIVVDDGSTDNTSTAKSYTLQ